MSKKKFFTWKGALNLGVDVLFDIAGSVLYGTGVLVFTSPNDIAPGGITGLSTVINHFVPAIEIGTINFLINIPLLIIAMWLFGKKLAIKTIKSTAILSLVMNILAMFVPAYEGNPLLAALFGGVCMGTGLSVVFMRGSTTGGTDILGRLFQRLFPGTQTGRAILVIDFMVLLTSAIAFQNIETFLYGIVAMFASSRLVDALLYGPDTGKVAMIVSDKKEEIGRTIIAETGRGCTFLKATGAYTNNDHNVIMCAVRKQQYTALKKLVFRVDPEAFVIVLPADEIIGFGFKPHTNDTHE